MTARGFFAPRDKPGSAVGIISDTWSWLESNHRQLGAAASVVFGVSSAIVAVLGLRLAAQNNFGRRPVVLLISWGYGGGGGQGNFVRCRFEVWNRRKYSVVVREVQVSFGAVKAVREDESGYGDPPDWEVSSTGNAYKRQNEGIEAGGHLRYESLVRVGTANANIFAKGNRLQVWVNVFDPRKNRHMVLTAKDLGPRKTWRRFFSRSMPSY